MFAHDMKWGDDLTRTVVTATSLGRRGTLQLAIYALHLWSGNNLHCRSLKLATIQRYISNVASFLCLFGRARVNYRYAHVGDKGFSPVLQAVFDELKRWEQVPRRHEPLTLEMVDAQAAIISSSAASFLSLDAALLDWLQVGLFIGPRLAEWGQPNGNWDPNRPTINLYLDTQAFTLRDIRSETTDHRRLPGPTMLDHPPHSIRKVWIT